MLLQKCSFFHPVSVTDIANQSTHPDPELENYFQGLRVLLHSISGSHPQLMTDKIYLFHWPVKISLSETLNPFFPCSQKNKIKASVYAELWSLQTYATLRVIIMLDCAEQFKQFECSYNPARSTKVLRKSRTK